ncbi:serine hydrolase domain-containing protein [Devosia sp. Leaf420]|uniref:serine hydrolase domain-containing protein n=1 Tax=Devosia sp. Leaf420 TaxID=1736374 RepID=UPI00078207A5|nr:serine hydrolase domain-containing protein [Devosia sp. Leaf420]
MDRAEVDRVIDEAVTGKKLVGTVVMAAINGEIVYSRAAGLADREESEPMREDTIFRAASLTKPLVAATILAMADRGLLKVTDPVSDYLPYFTPALPDGSRPVITLKHLLTHTAGLTYDYSKDPRISPGLTDTTTSLDGVLRLIAEQPLNYAPGTSWLYSMAIDVLGGVAAAVHGTDLATAVAHYVTSPLGMKDTVFHLDSDERLAVPYTDGETEPVRMTDPHAAKNPWNAVTTFSPKRIFNAQAFQSGGGGMATTAPDYMRFLMAVTQGGAPILEAQTARAALQDQMGYERDPGQAFSFFGSYTVDPARAILPWTAGTNNWGGIYGHVWSIEPSRKICSVSLTNTAFYGGELEYPLRLRQAIHA